MPLIVVAEDEILIAEVLAMMLEDAGYEVAAASHGRAALKLIREKHPALVITDFMMPLMTGLELATAMKSDGELSRIPVVLVSGAQGSVGRAHPDIFSAVLDKPYNEELLLKTVAKILSSSSLDSTT